MIEKAELWLLRHGTANGKSGDRSDLEDYARALTKKGVRQSIDAGRLLHKLAKVDKVYTSPRVRCVQSAVLVAEQLGAPFKRDKRLDHHQKHDPLEHVKDGGCVLLVCHKDVADQVKQLTGRTVEMSRGSLAKVSIVNGQATLDKLLSPADVARLLR